MSRWARRGQVGLVATVVAVSLVVLAPSAHGCSCAATTSRRVYDSAAAVFTGRAVSRSPASVPVSPDDSVDVEVREVFKGAMANRVSISPWRSSCRGSSAAEWEGDLGLYVLEESDGRLVPMSNACGPLMTIADARALAGSLPPASGRGDARAVVVTRSFGDVSLALIDRDGRPLAYGAGAGDVVALARCGDPNLLVTLSADAASRPDRGVIERWDLTTMRPTEVERVTSWTEPASVDCPTDGTSPRLVSPAPAAPPHLDPGAWQALSGSAGDELSAGRLPGAEGVVVGRVVGLAAPVALDRDRLADPPRGTPPPFGGHPLPLTVPTTAGGWAAAAAVVAALLLLVRWAVLAVRRRSRRADGSVPTTGPGAAPTA